MIALSPQEIAAIVHGTLTLPKNQKSNTKKTMKIVGDAQTDSRAIQPGQIFFARRGEQTDGHAYIQNAIQNGAALIVCEHIPETPDTKNITQTTGTTSTTPPIPHITVKNTETALAALAQEVINRVHAKGELKIIAITGSNGKTTTKNLVQALAATKYRTIASEKSFNNEVGAPLTMLRIKEDTQILVTEFGASKRGEIAHLASLAPPDIAVVLSVGLAHAGEFGGQKNTALAKQELVESLKPGTVAVLNEADPFVAAMAIKARQAGARIHFFNATNKDRKTRTPAPKPDPKQHASPAAQIRQTRDTTAEHPPLSTTAQQIKTSIHGSELQICTPEWPKPLPIKFPILGEHMIPNALAATAVAIEIQIPAETIAQTLAQTTLAAPGRMQQTRGKNGITIINDAYNASPDSMAAALRTLAQISTGRSIAVLGAMSELGELSVQAHSRVALQAVRLGIDEIVVVGEEAKLLHQAVLAESSLGAATVFFNKKEDALNYLRDALQPGDTVLVKSSNAAGLMHLGATLGELYS